jgi:hypothetical protein
MPETDINAPCSESWCNQNSPTYGDAVSKQFMDASSLAATTPGHQLTRLRTFCYSSMGLVEASNIFTTLSMRVLHGKNIPASVHWPVL